MERKKKKTSLGLIITFLLLMTPLTALAARNVHASSVDSAKSLIHSMKAVNLSEDDLQKKYPDPKSHRKARLNLEKSKFPAIAKQIDFKAIANRICDHLCDSYQKTPGSAAHFKEIFSRLVQQVAFPQGSEFFRKVRGLRFEAPEKIGQDREVVRISGNYPVDGEFEPVKLAVVLEKQGSSWLVVDFSVEGEELVSSWRGQISYILSHESYESLLEKLKTKLERVMTNQAF